MSENALKDQVVQEFVNLQRIKSAQDRETEIAYQDAVLRVRMQMLGIPADRLEIQ